MARRLHQTMADYVVIAISPALIMALVGSLVLFLLTVFYQGGYPERLAWVLCCFVFAAVLIGRIAIEEGFERAAPFGAVLAIVVAMAMSQFMEVQGTWLDHFGFLINWGLIALVWWCAHRLTWDCTLIDDAQDSSGEGLLQIAGFEPPADRRDQEAHAARQASEGTTSRAVQAGWWQRYVEHQRRPHAPGLSVVYFSLAALPLFGIGQWFIPASDAAGRRHAFWLLCVYVAAGLGLLLTTSFLGLRRYLRQRRIEMPTLMANLWLGTGAAIIGLLLLLAALLPRPSAEYAISQLPFTVGSPEQHSSRHAPLAREGVRDEEPGPAPQRPDEESQEQDSHDPKVTNAEGGKGPKDSNSEQPSSEKGGESETRSQTKSQQSGQGKQQSKSSADRRDATNEKPDSAAKQPSDAKQSDSPQNQSTENQPAPAEQNQASERKPSAEPTNAARQAARSAELAKAIEKRRQELAESQAETEAKARSESKLEPEAQDAPQKDDAQEENKSRPAGEMQAVDALKEVAETAAGGIAELFKWLFYAAFALFVAYVLWRSRAEVLRALREFLAALRDLWSGLFGGKPTHRLAAGDESAVPEFPPVPFDAFVDPFVAGTAGEQSTEELVRYSFEAFEAWSREHGCPRQPDDTPLELARDAGRLNPHIAVDARNLAELYGRVAYARIELPSGSREQLEGLWRKMRAGAAILS